MRSRSWEQARVLGVVAALVAAALHVFAGVFAWMQLRGGDGFQRELGTALRTVDLATGALVLLAALLVIAPPRSEELASVVPAARAVTTVLLVLAILRTVNSITLGGDQVEVVDRLQEAFEGGLPVAVLAAAARRIVALADAAADTDGFGL